MTLDFFHEVWCLLTWQILCTLREQYDNLKYIHFRHIFTHKFPNGLIDLSVYVSSIWRSGDLPPICPSCEWLRREEGRKKRWKGKKKRRWRRKGGREEREGGRRRIVYEEPLWKLRGGKSLTPTLTPHSCFALDDSFNPYQQSDFGVPTRALMGQHNSDHTVQFMKQNCFCVSPKWGEIF